MPTNFSNYFMTFKQLFLNTAMQLLKYHFIHSQQLRAKPSPSHSLSQMAVESMPRLVSTCLGPPGPPKVVVVLVEVVVVVVVHATACG